MIRQIRSLSFRSLLATAICLTALNAAGALREGHPPPYIGTPDQVVQRMLVLARVTADDTVIDLGSGDGRIVISAAKRFGALGLGVEMRDDLVALSRRNAEREGVAERARFVQQDALRTDLSTATVLTLYLSPDLNERLMPRILDTMRPGARVVSHDFAIGTWTPDHFERLDVPEKNNGRGGESTVLLWIVPANAAGRWRASIGSGASDQVLEFSIAQQFQFIEGAVHTAEGARRFPAASLTAERIVFQLPAGFGPGQAAGSVSARIDGDRMTGTASANASGAPVPFVAQRLRARPDIF